MVRSLTRRQAFIRRRRMLLVVPAAVVAAAALAACESSGASPGASSSSSSATTAPSASASASAAAAAAGLKTAKVGGVTVLTNAQGLTLYSFAPDTSAKSVCNGACATSWPPVKPAAAVKSPFATIKRADGATQLTFHGHPLYAFVGDEAPGQASGNGVNAFGGLWHEALTSGGSAPAGPASSNSGSYQY